MRLPSFDLSANGGTLIAVVAGALLATLSAVFATWFEASMKRRERERDAALLLGEIFFTLRILLINADRARGQGDPWGSVTMRILRSARREIDIYDRNRERLYDLRSADLRIKIHALILRTAMPLDGILDSANAPAAQPKGAPFAPLHPERDRAFALIMHNTSQMPAIVTDLRRLARRPLAADEGAGDPGAAAATGSDG
jgi:hypothetical protein